MSIGFYTDLDALPKYLRFYGASDYATMNPEAGKKEPDYTEHGVFGYDAQGDLWAVDWFFKQCETDVGIDNFIRLVGLWKPVRWWHEGGLIDKAIGPAIRHQMRQKQRFVTIEALPSMQDKGIKLQAFHARTHARTVHFPIKRAWAEHVIEELIKFPAGRWDDACDVCGLIGRGIDQMVDLRPPDISPKPQLVPFSAEWLEYGDRNAKPKVRFFA